MLSVAYIGVIGAWFIASRTTKDPVTDPHLAIAEALILTMAPVLLTLSAAIHHSHPAFDGHGAAQFGLLTTGLLALAVRIGPAVGNSEWRSTSKAFMGASAVSHKQQDPPAD